MFSSLHVGYSALSASQRSVEVAAHNVANANTPGFTRQRLAVQTAAPVPGTPGLRGDGMRGMGVTVMSVDRLRDRLADVAFRSEAGSSGFATARSATLTRAESVLGPYADGTPEAFSRFLASWDQLSLNPADPASRASVLAAGGHLADGIRSAWEQLDTVTGEVGLRVKDQVAEVNGLLESVGRLNLAIKQAVVSGQSPNDLRDERDAALDRVVGLTGARVVDGPLERTDIVLGDVSLVDDGEVSLLTATLDDDGLVSLSVEDADVVAGGQIGGYVVTAKADLVEYKGQLRTLAAGLRDAVNEVHREGSGLAGGGGRDFFVGEGADDLFVDPDLRPEDIAASRSGARADGENALALAAALRGTAAVDGATVAEALRAFGGGIGQAVNDAARNARTAAVSLVGAEQARASHNGINVDEEMVDLVKYQHAYSAASKVISVVDEMISRIIDHLGS